MAEDAKTSEDFWGHGFPGPFIISVAANLTTIAIVYVVGVATGLFGGRTDAFVAVSVVVIGVVAMLALLRLFMVRIVARDPDADDVLDSPAGNALGLVLSWAIVIEIVVLLKYYAVWTVAATVFGINLTIFAIACAYFYLSGLGPAFVRALREPPSTVTREADDAP